VEHSGPREQFVAHPIQTLSAAAQIAQQLRNAIVSDQLPRGVIRSAVNVELKNVARDLNDGNMAPDVADVTVRDVKERLVLLDSASGQLAENELREWLLERTSSRSS